MFSIALIAILLFFVALLRLRTSPQNPAQPSPTPTRHVSFSIASSDASYSPPSLPTHRRWSSPFHKRRPSITSADQFGRLLSSSSPASLDLSPKSPRRFSTSIRSLTSRRASIIDTHVPSPPSASTPLISPPSHRTRFVNPFRKLSRSRTPSPITLDTRSKPSTSSPSPPPIPRRSLANKFKSVFKSFSQEPSPIVHPKPIVKAISARLRRKPVPRTQPYGPPWNAQMPVPDLTLSQHSLQRHPVTVSPSPRASRKHSLKQSSPPEKTFMSPGQLSPRTFINQLDEKLFLLQQRIPDPIPSPHE